MNVARLAHRMPAADGMHRGAGLACTSADSPHPKEKVISKYSARAQAKSGFRASVIRLVVLFVIAALALPALSIPANAATPAKAPAASPLASATHAAAPKPAAKRVTKSAAAPVQKRPAKPAPKAVPKPAREKAPKPASTPASKPTVVAPNTFSPPQFAITDYNTSTVRVTGTAVDPSNSAAVTVRLTVGGSVVATTRTAADHSFSFDYTMPVNQFEVCVESLDVAATTVTPMQCFNLLDRQTATWAQVQAVIAQIDPKGTIEWDRQITAGSPDAYGLALPWKGIVQLAGDRIPLQIVRDVVLHEWSHVLQYRAGGSTPSGWLKVLYAADDVLGRPHVSNDDYALEHEADCMAQLQGANFLFYGCLPALMPLARQALNLPASTD